MRMPLFIILEGGFWDERKREEWLGITGWK